MEQTVNATISNMCMVYDGNYVLVQDILCYYIKQINLKEL